METCREGGDIEAPGGGDEVGGVEVDVAGPLHGFGDGVGRLAVEQEARDAVFDDFDGSTGGEGNREFAELREYLRHGSLDVYQADAAWSAGILRGKQLAAEVQAAGAIYSPHTWGDGLVLLANLHLSAAVSQAPFIEFPFDPPAWTPERRDFILPAPLYPDGPGSITLPDQPGLGVTIDWSALEPLRI